MIMTPLMCSFVMIIKASLACSSIFTNDAVIIARLSRQVPYVWLSYIIPLG